MKSRRLTFRELRESDAERIAYLAGDWDIARMTARIPYPYSEPQAHEWLRLLVRAASQGGEIGARYAALAVRWPVAADELDR